MQIGLEQSEHIKALVPRIALKRLQEMVVNGEMRAEFERVWNSAGLQSGNVESLLARVEARWESQQLPPSPVAKHLPDSSTELSEND